MKKHFFWMMAAILVCGAVMFSSCSSDDDDKNNSSEQAPKDLTMEVLKGLWVADYSESGTEGDKTWTRTVEAFQFSEDNTTYHESFQLNGEKLVMVKAIRDDATFSYSISGNTITIKGSDDDDKTVAFTYADGKLTTPEGMVLQKATDEQKTLVNQLYGEASGGNDSSYIGYIEYEWNGTELVKKYRYQRAQSFNDLSTSKSQTISGVYYVSGSYSSSHRLYVNGSLDLILCDGCELKVNGIYVNNGATLRIFGQDKSNGHLVIHINDDSDAFYPAIGAYDGDGARIEIHGGDIDARGGNQSAGIGGGSSSSGSSADRATPSEISIYNGRVFAVGKGGAGIGAGAYDKTMSPTINIYGGVVEGRSHKATKGGGCYGAGIGSGEETSFASVNIYGGIVSAYGADESAGIGCGQNSPNNKGVVNIYGGYVLAEGGDRGAGIGGGDSRTLDQINIHGGEVYAYAGVDGAGIGGGESGGSGYITITGGTVRAYGDRDHEGDEINGYGAGIGSGQDGIAYTIKISGGDIVAYGGWDAAGIGTGEETSIWAYINTIQISGGKVYARGKRYGVGIGVGEDGHCDIGKIEITGGTVHAHGDENYCGNWTGAMGAFHEDHRDNDWQDCKSGKYGWGRIYIGKCMRLHTWTAYNGYWEHVSYTANWWDYVHGRSEVIFEECNHVDGAYDITNCPYCHSYTLQLK